MGSKYLLKIMIEREGSDLFLTTGAPPSMKAFDAALYDIYKSGKISYEEALKNAGSKNNLRLRIQLSEGKDADEVELDEDDDSGGLSLVSQEDDSSKMF
jgi:Tfp pilus assembly ATPase PilU